MKTKPLLGLLHCDCDVHLYMYQLHLRIFSITSTSSKFFMTASEAFLRNSDQSLKKRKRKKEEEGIKTCM